MKKEGKRLEEKAALLRREEGTGRLPTKKGLPGMVQKGQETLCKKGKGRTSNFSSRPKKTRRGVRKKGR